MKQREYWDLYDKKTNALVCIHEKHKPIPPHLYHKTVEVIVTDLQGHILITRRSLKKNYGGGLFEFPAGSVKTGETPAAAAIRELKEETGLAIKRLVLISKKMTGEMMRYIYLGELPDLCIATVTLNPFETEEYRIITYSQWIALMKKGDFDLTRAQSYSDVLYNTVKEKVGVPIREEKTTPLQQTYKKADKFCGSYTGLSGKPFVPTEPDIDEEEEKWISVYDIKLQSNSNETTPS